MKIIYANQPIDPDKAKYGSIFLAGPTPRSEKVLTWRVDALHLFALSGYKGILFVPEDEDGSWKHSYNDQIEWEELGLRSACCIMFWLPRIIPEMMGLTTNDEWGVWKKSGKVVFGAPPDAEKVKYQRYYADKYRIPNFSSLEDTVLGAISMDTKWKLHESQ